jgi:hypothetical protein
VGGRTTGTWRPAHLCRVADRGETERACPGAISTDLAHLIHLIAMARLTSSVHNVERHYGSQSIFSRIRQIKRLCHQIGGRRGVADRVTRFEDGFRGNVPGPGPPDSYPELPAFKMASLRGESSNQLLEILEEWNDHLER